MDSNSTIRRKKPCTRFYFVDGIARAFLPTTRDSHCHHHHSRA